MSTYIYLQLSTGKYFILKKVWRKVISPKVVGTMWFAKAGT
jgi:hypothetical protein